MHRDASFVFSREKKTSVEVVVLTLDLPLKKTELCFFLYISLVPHLILLQKHLNMQQYIST